VGEAVGPFAPDTLPEAEFAALVAPLFERAPGFIERLAAGRPYGSWSALFERAVPLALGMTREAQIELIDAHPRIAARTLGLTTTQALDLIERLDRSRRFDAIILRSFGLCLRAIERPSLRGRVWSAYILEPERDPDDAA
jgi:hypothetical protein